MKWRPGECRYGDIVRVRIGSIRHYGVFVSEDEIIAFGLPPVPEYRDRPERLTVTATDADTFSCGSIIERAEYTLREKIGKRSPKKTVAAARARLGETGYNIIHNNCEHFVNECAFGVSRCSVEEEARKRWLSRPICDVYLAPIPDDPEYAPVAPPERGEEIASCRSASLKAAKFTDWKLLGEALRRSLGVDISDVRFRKTSQGRWCADGFDFSLSHTGRAVAVAVSNGPGGIDAESVRLRPEIRRGESGKAPRTLLHRKRKGKIRGRSVFVPRLLDEKGSGIQKDRKGIVLPVRRRYDGLPRRHVPRRRRRRLGMRRPFGEGTRLP